MFRALHFTSKVGFNAVKSALGMESADPLEAMQEIGWVYSKVAQNYSVGDPGNAVFDECVPVNKPELDARFRRFCAEHAIPYDEEMFRASGSVGGVFVVPYAGTTLAVKVRYPGIEDLFRQDVAALQRVARVSPVRGFDPVACSQQVEQFIASELDYRREAAYTRRFHALCTDLPVVVPTVYDACCEDDIVATGFVDSDRLFDALAANSLAENTALIRSLYAFVEAGWKAGMLYVDPHWGNILVEKGGERRLVVVDFGNVVDVEPGEHFARIGRLFVATRDGQDAFRAACRAEGCAEQTDCGYREYCTLLSFLRRFFDRERSGVFDAAFLAEWTRQTTVVSMNMTPLDDTWVATFKMINMLLHVSCKAGIPTGPVFAFEGCIPW